MAVGSPQNELTSSDWKKWGKNTLIFSIPTILALLTSLQSIITGESVFPSHTQLVFVVGSAYQALLASTIDLLIKYRSDNTKK